MHKLFHALGSVASTATGRWISGRIPLGALQHMNTDHAIYQIGLKVLLQKDNRVLLLRDKDTGLIDLPGGRISSSEAALPLQDILNREIREELSSSIAYTLGGPIFQYRRTPPYQEIGVLITVYGGNFISGDIALSEEHGSYEWVDPNMFVFQESDFRNQEERLAMQTYFEQIARRGLPSQAG